VIKKRFTGIILRVLNMFGKKSECRRKEEFSIDSIRENIKEVISYISLVISRSTINPFILARIESEIGLSLEAVKVILLKLDEIALLEKEGLEGKESDIREILSWIPVLKRFQVVLRNLPAVAGPYGDLEMFSFFQKVEEKMINILNFLEQLVK